MESLFPRAQPVGTTSLPSAAQFWMPTPDEISEEGFGFFRDTWLLRDVRVSEARAIISSEMAIADVVAHLATDADAFELFASVAESGGIDDPAEDLSDDERRILGEVVSDVPELGGLELGVAGLAHALATVRILPAASCRSHTDRSWSDAPVVIFAATEYRARALQPLVEATGCTFVIDQARPQLLAVRGRTIENTMALADAVMSSRATFVQKRGPRRPRSTRSQQERLF